MNVTLIGYHDKVAVGFVGCRDAIPHLQRLAVYTGEALQELENAIPAAPMKRKPTPAPRKRPTRKRRESRS